MACSQISSSTGWITGSFSCTGWKNTSDFFLFDGHMKSAITNVPPIQFRKGGTALLFI